MSIPMRSIEDGLVPRLDDSLDDDVLLFVVMVVLREPLLCDVGNIPST